MGRAPCCEKVGLKRGRWTSEEDETLTRYIQANGEGSWKTLPKKAGLLRCGKSCRLRWINYLRGDLKRGNFTQEEEEMIVKLHKAFGNRWSMIASHLPGRTDNEIKNYWNSHLSRQIYRFVNSKNKTQTSIDIATLVNQKTKRIGRVSRSVAKKYNKNTVFNNDKSAVDKQIDQIVGDCSTSVTNNIKESQVCGNGISDKLGWKGLWLQVQDDDLIDIDYFLESEAMDSNGVLSNINIGDEDQTTEQILGQIEVENGKNNEWNNVDETLSLMSCSKTKLGFCFDEIDQWDMEFGFRGSSNMCDKAEDDDMLVWLWEGGNP